MKRLLRFELYKMIRMKSLYICALIPVILNVGIAFIDQCLTKGFFNVAASDYILSVAAGSLLPLTAGIFTALYISDDFQNHTMKNIVARGYSRTMVYLAKLISSSVGILIMFGINLLSEILISMPLGLSSAGTKIVILSVIAQLIVMLALNAMYLMICMLLGKSVISVAIVVVGPTLAGALLSVLSLLLRKQGINLSDYWIDGLLSKLVDPAAEIGFIMKQAGIALAYLSVFLSGGIALFRKKEF